MYEYRAYVISVYDGDTITVDIDLGFGVWLKKQKIRLARIDTPEIKGDERAMGLIARDRVRELIMDKDVTIRTKKDKKGKYGRWIAEVIYDNINLNDQLLQENLAKQYV